MALIDIYNSWSGVNGTLSAKFIGACLKSAYNVLNEAPETVNHANRLVWANAIIGGDTSTVTAKAMEMLRYAAASNATIQTVGNDATDNDVEYIVASQINILATG